ncbi:unnamed protein product [Owenia fusiformis]|uniref:Uncharacterized protein n=1 Tax=Owenia fusiformis TaxID=6347 RepID=A0A8J1Y5X2_OWEFU|nr:unnamed protein product [Owenia fusiformis]
MWRVGVWGCGARYCPNDVEKLKLHRLRQHALSPRRGDEPPSKRPKTVLRAVTLVGNPKQPDLSTTNPLASMAPTGSTTSATLATTTTTSTPVVPIPSTSIGQAGGSGDRKDPLCSGLEEDLLDWVQSCLDKEDEAGNDGDWSIGTPEPLCLIWIAKKSVLK